MLRYISDSNFKAERLTFMWCKIKIQLNLIFLSHSVLILEYIEYLTLEKLYCNIVINI